MSSTTGKKKIDKDNYPTPIVAVEALLNHFIKLNFLRKVFIHLTNLANKKAA